MNKCKDFSPIKVTHNSLNSLLCLQLGTSSTLNVTNLQLANLDFVTAMKSL